MANWIGGRVDGWDGEGWGWFECVVREEDMVWGMTVVYTILIFLFCIFSIFVS